jgi:ferredoxin-NADP reductase
VFKVLKKTVESADVTSFELAARDSQPLASFQPGQHLPVEVNVDGSRYTRTYSLSAAADAQRYRLTVKRESHGVVSRYLHDRVEAGDSLRAAAPAGDFRLLPDTRSVVLISAGVGVTPMLSMLQTLADPGQQRQVLFVHGVRNGRHHPMKQEVNALVSGSARLRACIAYSQPDPEDKMHSDYQHHGRIDVNLIDSLVAKAADAVYYLCGPVSFMAQLRAGLMAIGVPEVQIYAELFGPAG